LAAKEKGGKLKGRGERRTGIVFVFRGGSAELSGGKSVEKKKKGRLGSLKAGSEFRAMPLCGRGIPGKTGVVLRC